MTRARAAVAAALALAAAMATACSSGADSSGATTTTPSEATSPTTAAPATTTTQPVPTVPGTPRSTTTLAATLGPGRARITGTVVGPRGPVPAATVRVRRSIGATEVGTDVVTNAAGGFAVDAVQGGRYLVRAWKVPDLAMAAAESFFLGAEESRNLQLRVDSVGAVNVQATTDADPLPAGAVVNLTVFVFTGAVNAAGDLVASPLPGTSVRLTQASRIEVLGSDQALADGGGDATFRVRCTAPGDTGSEAVVAERLRFVLTFPPCR